MQSPILGIVKKGIKKGRENWGNVTERFENDSSSPSIAIVGRAVVPGATKTENISGCQDDVTVRWQRYNSAMNRGGQGRWVDNHGRRSKRMARKDYPHGRENKVKTCRSRRNCCTQNKAGQGKDLLRTNRKISRYATISGISRQPGGTAKGKGGEQALSG